MGDWRGGVVLAGPKEEVRTLLPLPVGWTPIGRGGVMVRRGGVEDWGTETGLVDCGTLARMTC